MNKIIYYTKKLVVRQEILARVIGIIFVIAPIWYLTRHGSRFYSERMPMSLIFLLLPYPRYKRWWRGWRFLVLILICITIMSIAMTLRLFLLNTLNYGEWIYQLRGYTVGLTVLGIVLYFFPHHDYVEGEKSTLKF